MKCITIVLLVNMFLGLSLSSMEMPESELFTRAKNATKNQYAVVQKLYEDTENREHNAGKKLLLLLYVDQKATLDARAFAAKIVAKETMDDIPGFLKAGKEIPPNLVMELLKMLDFARKHLEDDGDVHFNFALLALENSPLFGETEDILLYNAYISLLRSEQLSGGQDQEYYSACFRKLYERTKEKNFDKIHELFNKYALSPLVHSKIIDLASKRTNRDYDQNARYLDMNAMTIDVITAAAYQNFPPISQYFLCFKRTTIYTQ